MFDAEKFVKLLEPELSVVPASYSTAYIVCDKHKIFVNEDYVNNNEVDTLVGLLIHEVAHYWWEPPTMQNCSTPVRFVLNVLEDGRVETYLTRLMPGARSYLTITLQQFVLPKTTPRDKYKKGSVGLAVVSRRWLPQEMQQWGWRLMIGAFGVDVACRLEQLIIEFVERNPPPERRLEIAYEVATLIKHTEPRLIDGVIGCGKQRRAAPTDPDPQSIVEQNKLGKIARTTIKDARDSLGQIPQDACTSSPNIQYISADPELRQTVKQALSQLPRRIFARHKLSGLLDNAALYKYRTSTRLFKRRADANEGGRLKRRVAFIFDVSSSVECLRECIIGAALGVKDVLGTRGDVSYWVMAENIRKAEPDEDGIHVNINSHHTSLDGIEQLPNNAIYIFITDGFIAEARVSFRAGFILLRPIDTVGTTLDVVVRCKNVKCIFVDTETVTKPNRFVRDLLAAVECCIKPNKANLLNEVYNCRVRSLQIRLTS